MVVRVPGYRFIGSRFDPQCSHNLSVKQEHVNVTRSLSDLQVWQEAAIPGGLPGWILNTTFKKNMKIALLGR
uniref:(California timema) hypothetical protein n=1 Tax=Timema californicum TaxID=61474 RepID=A0A7R9JHX2_TIMCA|nr:unnamed protein product [Timema californicum]